jgi:SpoVK/Ycf46/Vps4 family AAA+-type ATPase
MNARQKELLESLIRSHGKEQSGFDDIIKGKGKGLVGLLLGPPGVGKTLTAEAVAEISQLPLYVMSCGGLGSDAHEINRSLKTYLELASRWNAVLLLDEADVYLAKRNDNDLERNAIISVFLREIEYYTGILILTTNRAQSIDPAFQSKFVLQRDGRKAKESQAVFTSAITTIATIPPLGKRFGKHSWKTPGRILVFISTSVKMGSMNWLPST